MSSYPTARDHTKASVLDAVLAEAPLTRNRLIELTRLSQPTVSRKVDELLVDGFVVEQGVNAVPGRGRRSTYLDVPGTAGHIVGISFGAQTTCVLVTDLRGREVRHVIVPSLDEGDVGTTAEWLVDLIVETSDSAEGPLRQIVTAVPGRVRYGTEWSGIPESRKIFRGSLLQNAIEDRVQAPMILESDASASLRGILKDDASIGHAALFMLSTVLTFASCTDHEIAQGRTPAFGDLGGVLFSGVGNETLDGLMSAKGLLQFARGRGLHLEGIEALWSQPQEMASRAEVVEAFTTAIVTAVGAVAVTLDPESVYFVGRLSPLVDEVLPEAGRRLAQSLPVLPELRVVPQVIGLSVARGAAHAGLALAQSRLRESMLEARSEGQSP
ncbi:putative NBD/HSP70 family sugar kinase [Arthrobacter pascens]|uniref:ROK family transcriptional regulator n=1 Tax=Arthrobacter pascens TaxID=1677 RepID=UPI00278FFC3C|nr:helix-turn-helix domain-containing protein [Arthrobacter pascens]MDQ0678632.1 putative NBD/HSP70 family sugar kinase [Arthrobacter pascens]